MNKNLYISTLILSWRGIALILSQIWPAQNIEIGAKREQQVTGHVLDVSSARRTARYNGGKNWISDRSVVSIYRSRMKSFKPYQSHGVYSLDLLIMQYHVTKYKKS